MPDRLPWPDRPSNLTTPDDVFAMRGIDRDWGCVVVVRPDQYAAHILPLDAHAELDAFFDNFMTGGRTEEREAGAVHSAGAAVVPA